MSEEKKSEATGGKDLSEMDVVTQFFAQKIDITTEVNKQKVFSDLTFDGLIKHWKEKGFKKIITMVGAGISTSAGIPDFRSPGSGIYHNLEKFELPDPTLVFEIHYFLYDPLPFFALAKELYPGKFYPTPSHYFCRLLHEKGLLLRHYTQNIDTLERIAGIPVDKLVEAHGTFYTNHCLECRKSFTMEWMKEKIFADVVPTCDKCNSVVKPDVVFFGENLSEDFFKYPTKDFKECDLLIIMGTSLKVNPFASLIDNADPRCVRLLINKTKVGHDVRELGVWFMHSPGLKYDDEKNNIRDVAYIGDCDDGVFALADGLGWGQELRDLIKSEHERLKSEENLKKEAKDESKPEDIPKESSEPKSEDKKDVPGPNSEKN